MKRRTFALLAVVAVSCLFALASSRVMAVKPAEIDDAGRYVWDPSSLYPGDDAWEAERRSIVEGAASIGRFAEGMDRDAASLADALDAIADLRRRATQMTIYGELVSNLDTRSAEARRRYAVGTELVTRVESAVAFLPEAVARIGESRVEHWLAEEPRLARHRIRLTRILREAAHTLPSKEQGIVESMARWPHLCADVHDALFDADLGWPLRPGADGKGTRVLPGTLRIAIPPERRPEAAAALMARLSGMRDLFALLYTRRIDADLTIARHRGFADGVDAEWFLRDGMPAGSARIMVEEARKNLPLLHRYLQVRARALRLPRAAYADLYLPAPDAGQRFTASRALEIAVDASAPLGKEYQERLRRRIGEGWMHLPAWPRKRGVFEVFPAIGTWHPLMLTSFTPTYRGARQLLGAWTDMMKDAEVPPEGRPDSRDDPPAYGNGIIYVGDMLFDDYMRGRAPTREARIADAVQALDLIWSNYFQTALMAELDARVQTLVAAGNPPGGEDISALYRKLLGDYAGPAEVDDAFAAEWMTYDVTFYSYEHQFWAPAVAAAANIVEKVEAGDPDGVKAVVGVLGRGDSDRSYFLLRRAGIDLHDPGAYGALFRRMRGLLEELEAGLRS